MKKKEMRKQIAELEERLAEIMSGEWIPANIALMWEKDRKKLIQRWQTHPSATVAHIYCPGCVGVGDVPQAHWCGRGYADTSGVDPAAYRTIITSDTNWVASA